MKYERGFVKKLTLIFAGLFFYACATVFPPKITPLSFNTAESLPLGSTKEYVLKTLGKPGFIPDPKTIDMSAIPENEELWYYLDPVHHTDRLSVVFDRNTDTVISVGWSIKEDEPESDLEYLQKKYSAHHFRTPPPEASPHFISDERHYINDDLGLRFTYAGARGKVDSIAWWIPEHHSLAGKKPKQK